jgi:hypothetical protein
MVLHRKGARRNFFANGKVLSTCITKSPENRHTNTNGTYHIEIVPTAFEEYADIIDGVVNNSYFCSEQRDV